MTDSEKLEAIEQMIVEKSERGFDLTDTEVLVAMIVASGPEDRVEVTPEHVRLTFGKPLLGTFKFDGEP